MDYYRPPTIQSAIDALGTIYRALRAWKFYPKGHPSRKITLRHAHAAMLDMLDGNTLSLNVSRTGFNLPDGETLRDSSQLCTSLAYELFIRRVQKVTFLHDLYQEDLLDFTRILTMHHDEVYRQGGTGFIMANHGIRTIWVNEFDISVLLKKRREVEQSGVIPPGVDDLETAHTPDGMDSLADPQVNLNPADELNILLGRLQQTTDEDIYLLLVRQSVLCGDALKSQQMFVPLFPLVELLAEQSRDPGRSVPLVESARFGLEQLAMGEEFLAALLDQLNGKLMTHDSITAVVLAGGPPALIQAVEKLGNTDDLAIRKSLTGLLVKLGDTAVSPLLPLLNDSRWYMVRNLAAILGDISSQAAVPSLQKCLRHKDQRVCKEAIRSLAKIGGKDAETSIIAVLRSTDSFLLPQAITSLGAMKSRRSLGELLNILEQGDRFLKTLPLKLEILAALGLIGDPLATPRIMALIEKKHLFARSRWEQLKIAAAHCLGRLGDKRALPLLRARGDSSDPLGIACAEAADVIERTESNKHGGI